MRDLAATSGNWYFRDRNYSNAKEEGKEEVTITRRLSITLQSKVYGGRNHSDKGKEAGLKAIKTQPQDGRSG